MFDVALIVALVGAPAREGDVFSFTIGQYFRVDKLASVVGIQTKYGKRDQLTRLVERLNDERLATVQQWQTFRPASGHIGEGERGQVGPLGQGATMGHQVDLQKARLGIVPALKGADGDLLLKQ